MYDIKCQECGFEEVAFCSYEDLRIILQEAKCNCSGKYIQQIHACNINVSPSHGQIKHAGWSYETEDGKTVYQSLDHLKN
jgi:hypothetical protein